MGGANSFALWLTRIQQDLQAGKRLFIYISSSKDSAGRTMPSIEALGALCRTCTIQQVLVYHGDNDEALNKTLNDVNRAWAALGLVITNSKITVGVNFDAVGFHRAYVCLIDGCTQPRDVIQASYRVRSLKDNLVVAAVTPGFRRHHVD